MVGIIGYNPKIMENSTKITHTPEGQNILYFQKTHIANTHYLY